MSKVTSEEVAAFWPVVEAHAKRMSRVSYLAEFDDLVQMGAIAVWQTLERGNRVTNDIILNAMRKWIGFVTHGGRVDDLVTAV